MDENACTDQVEVVVRRKAIAVTDFPHNKVRTDFTSVSNSINR